MIQHNCRDGKARAAQRPNSGEYEIHDFNRAVSFGIPPFLDCPGKTSGGKTY